MIAALDSAATGSKELCTALDEAFRPNLAYVWVVLGPDMEKR